MYLKNPKTSGDEKFSCSDFDVFENANLFLIFLIFNSKNEKKDFLYYDYFQKLLLKLQYSYKIDPIVASSKPVAHLNVLAWEYRAIVAWAQIFGDIQKGIWYINVIQYSSFYN